ncbi:Mut7-C ubiquitin/RNAse domain-containing protein [Blastococcus mobilis]|uniref:Mut7-C ubiquitin/RNAse domain-containing protein n=1 Tax=Blastococcus mobilis TaxID=1938746 RepID=UPI0020CBE365|nr:Mut7-C ubiquitin/RNAse domain-containing protein [Blastococcus mobilis]
MTEGVEIVVPTRLRFLLSPRDRPRGARRMDFDADATVGHLIQAAGVPLTEVGRLRLDGAAVPPSARPYPGSTIEVDEVERPQPLPPGGFLLDVGLGALARRLRLLGLDVAWSNDADDPDLVVRATTEDRVLLTQDRRLLMRRALPRGALVRGSHPDDQLADVLDRFAPEPAPLTRCTACGGSLAPVAKEEVAHLLEPATRRSYEEFVRCASCARVYWHGAHAARIEAMIRRATGR